MKPFYGNHFLISLLVFISFSLSSFAAHIIGNDITVQRLSANNYRVTVNFFRDCAGAGAGFENPLIVFVYDKVTNAKIMEINMGAPAITNLPEGDACYPSTVCVEKGVYTATAIIANNPNGYYLTWMRCCRNNGIVNITGSSSEGSIFYAEICDPAIANSSPYFNTIPQSTQGYMCAGSLNFEDFSATDPDGDKLVYSLVDPLSCNPTGQCSSWNNSPQVSGATGLQGPYGTVTWGAGYSTAQPFGAGTTTLSATTGQLSVTPLPASLGMYVMCVKVEEFRIIGGVLTKIGEIRRDFQFNLFSCQKLNISVAPTTTVCIGQVATLTGSGGLAGWTYSWSPGGQTGPTITSMSLVNGTTTYTVVASNGINCIMNTGAFITNSPTANIATTGNVCQGQNTTLTASGAGSGGTYNWMPGNVAGATLTGVTNGQYTVTSTNANACTATAVGTVYQAPVITGTVAVNNVSCSGTTASATVTASPGSPPYTYSWTGITQTTSTVTGLANGTHSCTVTDSKGCSVVKTFNVSVTSNPVIPITPISAGCTVSNGTATVNASGGGGTYTYLWGNGQTTSAATGLTAGNTYSVLVTSANGCTKTNSVTIAVTSNPAVTGTSSTAAGCTVSNGTASATGASGGTGAYTYVWSTGQTAQTATGLAGGNYTVTVHDANGCTGTKTVTVSSTNPPTIATTSSTVAGCSVSNGTATANPAGGTGGYTYTWSPGGQNSQTATGLAGGSYTVTVADANNCTVASTVSVSTSNPPAIATTSSTIAGCSVSNGTAFANPSGGTGGYTYTWMPGGQNSQTATGLAGGNYTITVTDANNCTGASTVSVGVTTAPTMSVTPFQSTCGFSNGSATAVPTGGTPGYTYLWVNGQTTQTVTGLTAGLYTVTVTDLSGCTASDIANISNAGGPAATTSVNGNVLCFGGNTASATANPSIGTPAYTYLWTNGETTQTATGLTVGGHNVTVTDANGCLVVASVSITEPPVLAASTAPTNVLCNSGTTGSATVIPTGGTPGYTYNWSSGASTSSATALSAGNYTVTVTDANGCSVIKTCSITVAPALTSSTSQTSVLCNGGTGSASVTISGGTPAYSYSWNNGQTTSAISGIAAGNYSLTITDANGCTGTNSVSVTQPAVLTSSTTQSTILCNGGTANASVTASGGTTGYTYNWSSGASTSSATALSAGNYTVTVTDMNGCTSTNTLSITQPAPLVLSGSCNDSICAGDSALLSVSASGGIPNYTYTWLPGPQAGQSISVSPTSSTIYLVTSTDANGCISAAQSCSVSILPVPNANFDTLSNGMFGATYGFTDQSTGSQSWFWDFGDGGTSPMQNPIHTFPGAGTYTVTQIAYNQFGCPDTFKIVVDYADGILIPNVFTPDGDGVNDVWYIPNSGLRDFHVVIFDRWGLKVFETSADEIRWDGHSTAGTLLSDGTYYFVLKAVLASFNGDKDYSTHGYVTLLTQKRKQ